MSTATTTAAPPSSKPSVLTTLLGTGVGNMMEWFDWNVYSTFSIYFSTQVFSSKDEKSAFLNTLAVFAVGFIARPFGGLLFGWLADRIGRKRSLEIAVILASVGSLLIAICPTYAQWGWAASLVLVTARIIQGLAHGGEMPSAQTYLSEEAPRNHRGLWSSIIYVTGTLGLVIGMLIGLIEQTVLGQAQLNSWGWRVPFAIGAVLGLFALWIRTRLEETEAFEEAKEEGKTDIKEFFTGAVKHWPQALQVIGMTCGLTCAYYVWSVATTSHAVKDLHFHAQDAFWASIIGNVFMAILLPFWGMLSDRIGRKPLLLFSMLGGFILFVPMQLLIKDQFWQLTLAICVMLFVLSANLAIAPAVYAEMFPTHVRASGMGLPYALTIAAFGGTAPLLISAWGDHPWYFRIWTLALLAISGLTILTMRETKGIDLRPSAAEVK